MTVPEETREGQSLTLRIRSMVLPCTALVTREKDSLPTDRVNALAFSRKPIITSTKASIGGGSFSEGCVGWDLDFFDFFGVFSFENILEAASRMV